MLAPTHRAFATTATAITMSIYNGYQQLVQTPSWTDDVFTKPVWVIILIIAVLFSTAPDIDRKLNLFHRGYTHGLWMNLLLWYGCISAYITGEALLFVPIIGITIGWTSHCVGDSYSVSGIEWFYPFRKYQVTENGTYKLGKRILFPKLYKVGERALRWYKQGTYELKVKVPFPLPSSYYWYTITIILLILNWK